MGLNQALNKEVVNLDDKDHHLLANFNFMKSDYPILMLTQKGEGTFPVFVTDMKGPRIELKVKHSWTVFHLKLLIEQRTNVHRNNQMLLHGGKILQHDQKQLSAVGI